MKRILVAIKGLLGLCQAKGCRNKSVYVAELQEIKVKRQLCEECAQRLVRGATVKSVMIENEFEF